MAAKTTVVPMRRPFPFTLERAITELVGSHRELERARGSLERALEILGTLPPRFDAEMLERVLDDVALAHLELARALAPASPRPD